jgi:hypothetical protein
VPARRGLIAAIVVAVASLVLASVAPAVTDDLKGGSAVMQLRNSKGLKVKPKALTLPITSGSIDPVDGSGTAYVTGAFKARRGKSKAKVKLISLTLGANGGPGTIAAKVGKNRVNNFGSLIGGTVARSATGFGTTISNITAKVTSSGLKAISGGGKGKGKKSATSAKTAPLGTITSLTTIPLAVHVIPGQGSVVLHTNAMGSFVNKLPQHCIDAVAGNPAGVTPIPPATTTGPLFGLLPLDYIFPVTNGAIGPDFSAGELFTAGGQTITKNSSLTQPSGCPTTPPPVGSKLLSTNLSIDFASNALASIATLPDGTTLPRAPLADINWSTGTRSVNPTTGAVTVTGATVTLASLAAQTLNNTFPNVGPAGNEFATGDLIGTIDVTGVTLR